MVVVWVVWVVCLLLERCETGRVVRLAVEAVWQGADWEWIAMRDRRK